jgi:hypothetical protein
MNKNKVVVEANKSAKGPTLFSNRAANEPFTDFILKNKINRRYLLIATVGIIVQFIIFKIFYPFPDYFSDSYTYISVAQNQAPISFRPVGYSRFLAFLHSISSSDDFLIWVQYLIFNIGALYLFFTVRYFFDPRRLFANIIFGFLLFNTATWYISNTVASDTVFIGLSFLFMGGLLWVINKPKWYSFVLPAIAVFLLFKTRFIALYYPVIPLFAFLISRQKLVNKLIGIAACVLPVIMEAQRIKNVTYEETGTAVFSAFSGWMSANTALIIYPYCTVENDDFPTPESAEVNAIAKDYFKRTGIPHFENFTIYKYMWDREAPPKFYMYQELQRQHYASYFDAWNGVAPAFSDFSSTVIKKNPGVFFKHFLLPNAKQYLVPDLESLVFYNTGKDSVDKTAADWFGYESLKVRAIDKNIQASILKPFTWLYGIINIIFVIALVLFFVRWKKMGLPAVVLHSVLLVTFFWCVNLASSVYATPIVFRFQLFPMYLYATFALVLMHYLKLYKKTN